MASRNADAALRQVGLRSLEAKTGINAFRDSIHVLRPVLDSVGLGLSNLGALSAAARVGPAGLTAAAIAATVAGLVKIGDAAKLTRQQVEAVLGPKSMVAVEANAKALGVSAEAIAGPAEKIADLQEIGVQTILPRDITKDPFAPRPKAPSAQGLSSGLPPEIESRLFQQMLTAGGGTTPDETTKAANDFFSSFRAQARNHPETEPVLTIPSLEALPRGGANALTRILGRGDNVNDLIKQIADGQEITFNQMMSEVARHRAQIEHGSKARPPEQRTVAESAGGAYQSVSREVLQPVGDKVGTVLNSLLDRVPAALDVLRYTTPLLYGAGSSDQAGRGAGGQPQLFAPAKDLSDRPGKVFNGALDAAANAAIGFATKINVLLPHAPLQIPSQATFSPDLGSGSYPLARSAGGMIHGPGTSTSDSILIRASDGEGPPSNARGMIRIGKSGL